MKIHNPPNADDKNVVAVEIGKIFGRNAETVSKNELMATIVKMRSMLGVLHVELYCANKNHPYFKQVFATLGAIGISEMERVRRLRMPKWKQKIITFFKGKA